TWIGENTFALTLPPEDERAYLYHWGKVLLADAATKQVSVLAEEGQLVAALPDGTLLLRRGWIDGELQALAPPYDAPPRTISPRGTWATGWAVSPDGQKVAWLELEIPPGDWSRRLPPNCCTPDPAPIPKAVAVWDKARSNGGKAPAQAVQRFPISGFKWSQPGYAWMQEDQLRWRKDSSALLYAAPAQDNPQHTAVLQLSLSGTSTLLAEHDWDGHITAGAG